MGDLEDRMVRMALWRWPSAILARKASPWLTVSRVPPDDSAPSAGAQADAIDLPIELSRRDFQDTLPIVFHLDGNLDTGAAPEA